MNRKPHQSNRRNHNRVSIIGGSIAGLTAGLALLRHGWDVHIYESTQDNLERRGAGIITQPSLLDLLQQLNVTSKENVGITIRTRKTFAKDGSIIGTYDLVQISSSWGRLYRLLKDHFPAERYHRQKVLVRCEQDSNAAKAYFSDGTCETSTLIIAADGIRSTVRKQYEPDAVAEYAGYIAWRGLINEHEFNAQEQRELFPYFTFCLPYGEQALSYPIAGEQHQIDPGNRRCNVVWYRPAARDSALPELLTDTDGHNNGESIAPNKIRAAVVKNMRNDAQRLLSPQHVNLIRKLDNPFIQPIYDLTTSTMAHGRVALIGDAAFTARPHLAVGITKAVEDALALSELLERCEDIPSALQQFSEQRHPLGYSWVQRSRELGAYLQAQRSSENERHHAQLHRTVEAVMRETATLPE